MGSAAIVVVCMHPIIRMHILKDDEIRFTSMNVVFKRLEQIKGTVYTIQLLKVVPAYQLDYSKSKPPQSQLKQNSRDTVPLRQKELCI